MGGAFWVLRLEFIGIRAMRTGCCTLGLYATPATLISNVAGTCVRVSNVLDDLGRCWHVRHLL